MLKRKIYNSLVSWKKDKDKECLLIKGARQIGKTYIIDKFGKENYSSYIYVNFIENPNLSNIFKDSLSADEIYKKLSVFILGIKFIEKDTLIFLDEIQACTNARSALKFLAIDNRYDVIASGSLLGINYKEESSIPVGYEKQMTMHALDFEEFLWAKNVDLNAIDYIKSFFINKERIDDDINKYFLNIFREYMVVGGMPDVVNKFIETSNFSVVHETQEKLLASYLDDIAKYAAVSEKPKTRNCYLSIPKQLAKENRKFQYALVESGGRARKYKNCIEWLRDANLVNYCFNVSTPSFPLKAYEQNDCFKIYLNDIGLLIAMYGFEIKEPILNNTLTGYAKGGIYENAIADVLIKKNIPLRYYKAERNDQEIEFLLQGNNAVIPIEVKAGNNASISLNNFIKENNTPYAYKFISGNIGVSGEKITLPLYMIMFLV
ncbi:MAG: ATP-binding protein [Bacillota bacterium]